MSSYECRICFSEGSNINDFISPCCCIGESQHVHKNCLNHWLMNNKGTDKYFKCEVCHCKYQRSSDDNNKEIIQKETGITGLMLTTISFSLLIFCMILINISYILCNIFLIILYLVSLSYAAVHNMSYLTIFIICLLLGTWLCGEKKRKIITEAWLLLVFIFIAYHFVIDGWNFIQRIIEVEFLTDFRSQMYDKYLGVYVDGII